MEGKNGRLRHYDGIRRLKATAVIVTVERGEFGRGGCQQPARAGDPVARIFQVRQTARKVGLSMNLQAEDRLRVRSRWNELRTRSRSLN